MRAHYFKIVSYMLLAIALQSGYAQIGPQTSDVASWTKVDKDVQRAAGKKLLAEITTAIDAGEKEFSIPKGDYRFTDLYQSDTPRKKCFIKFDGVKDFVLDGNGSNFWFDSPSGAIYTVNCTNMTIKNLFLDWDPILFTQGTITGIGPGKNEFTFEPSPGYANYLQNEKLMGKPKPKKNSKSTIDPPASGRLIAIFIDPQTKRLCAEPAKVDPVLIKQLDDKSFLMRNAHYSTQGKAQLVGSYVTLSRRYGTGRAVKTSHSSNIRYEDIVLYSSPFVTFVEYDNKKAITYLRCKIVTRPGTDRLLASNADGFNSDSCLEGPRIEDCEIENIGDDFVNIHGVYKRVFKMISPTQFIVEKYKDNESDDAVLNFLEGKTNNYLGGQKVIKKENAVYIIKKTGKKWAANSNYKEGQKVSAVKITLDAPIKEYDTLNEGAIFSVSTAVGAGTIIKNCTFRGSRARGIRLQSYDTTITGNIIDNCAGWGLSFGGQPGYWGESATSQNVLVDSNTFSDCCYGDRETYHPGLATICVNAPGTFPKGKLVKNIQITNNKIINSSMTGIYMNNCEDVIVEGNTIDNWGFDKNPDYKSVPAIMLNKGKNVKIEGNIYKNPGEFASNPPEVHDTIINRN